MNTSLVQVKEPLPVPDTPPEAAESAQAPVVAGRLRVGALLAWPVATAIALAVHQRLSKNEPPADTRSYFLFLFEVFGLSILAAGLSPFWPGLRRWLAQMG